MGGNAVAKNIRLGKIRNPNTASAAVFAGWDMRISLLVKLSAGQGHVP